MLQGTYAAQRPASMGPRLISRGKTVGIASNDSDISGFNGAAADQPRKVERALGEEQAKIASMGPRLISRGKWMEARKLNPPGGASMGPRLISRGKSAVVSSELPRSKNSICERSS